ncbi:hypothetical protein GCM10019016_136490 [Streptomyces prasinosporus]|uniref:Uncharacterized protein n=1 Tax=Streptomyces prasinosporus TaxID=68256 RepID=A0ABP6UGE7_9ACTN
MPAQGGDGEGAEHVAADAGPAEAAESRSRASAGPGRRQGAAGGGPLPRPRASGGRAAARRPSGRERHDEKITVYVSAEELMDLEHARLVLRGEHGTRRRPRPDRPRGGRRGPRGSGEPAGDASILVRRLRGR